MNELKEYLINKLDYYNKFEDTQAQAKVIRDVLDKIENIKNK